MDGSSTLSAELVHASPGRLRLRLRPVDLGGSALGRAKQRLAALPAVREVQVNPLARSVVVLFDETSAETSELLTAVGRSGIRVIPAAPETGRGLLSRPLDQSIESFFGNADERVRQKSEGIVDLRTLVPVALAALAVREMLSGRLGAAPWYVLLWYSFNSFVNLRRPAESPGRGQDG